MPPGSKKSSASSNSTGTMRNTAAVQVETAATTPASDILTSTPLTVASPSTRTSASGAPSAKRLRVRGPTRGKRIKRIIAVNKGERISAYVTPKMRAFCGINANKVASELGTQIRWICPIQGFYSSWKNVDDRWKLSILQAVRDKFKVTENDVEGTELVEQVFNEKANLLYKDWKWRMNDFYTKTDLAGLDAYQHPYQEMHIDDWKYMIDHVFKDPKQEPRKIAGKKNRNSPVDGFSVASRSHTLGSRSFAAAITIEADKPNGKVPDLCQIYQASHTLKDGGWIDPQCAEIHARMVATQDEASQSGCPLTDEELSRKYLGEAKYYVRGFGVGPRPSSFSSKSSSNLAQQELHKVQSELELLREERQREREEYERRWEEERNQRDEEQRQREEQQRQRDEELRIRDEQRQREFDELKAMMMMHMCGRDNV